MQNTEKMGIFIPKIRRAGWRHCKIVVWVHNWGRGWTLATPPIRVAFQQMPWYPCGCPLRLLSCTSVFSPSQASALPANCSERSQRPDHTYLLTKRYVWCWSFGICWKVIWYDLSISTLSLPAGNLWDLEERWVSLRRRSMPGCSQGQQEEDTRHLHAPRWYSERGSSQGVCKLNTVSKMVVKSSTRIYYIYGIYLLVMIAILCRLAQKEILGLAERREVKIQCVDKTVLDSLSENKLHQVRHQQVSCWHNEITMSTMNLIELCDGR